jgi:hypothetical protein
MTGERIISGCVGVGTASSNLCFYYLMKSYDLASYSYLLGCSVAQLIVLWPAVWQARVQISARHPREVFPSERNKQ